MKYVNDKMPFVGGKNLIKITGFLLLSLFAQSGFSEPLNNYPTQLSFSEMWQGLIEDSGSNIVDYQLVVDANKKGTLIIQGFQIYMEMEVTLQDSESSTKVILESIKEDAIGPQVTKGDALLELNLIDTQLTTTWGKIQPALDENEKPGVYFKVVK